MTKSTSLLWIPSRARHLAAGGEVVGKVWSLAAVCEHLAMSLEATVRGNGDESPPSRWTSLSWFERVSRWLIRHYMLATGWFPPGVTAPKSVVPSGSVSLEDAFCRLEAAATEFELKLSTPGASWGVHSHLGRMSGRAWQRFHSIHASHHFSFFRTETQSQGT